MLDETDLSKCKKMAEYFLDIDIQADEVVPNVISHPFFQSYLVMDEETGELVNIIEDERACNRIRKQIKDKINEIENYVQFTSLITKPYRLAFLKYTREYLNKEDFSKYLIDTWVNDEYANCNNDVPKRELVKYFQEASKVYLMSEKELNFYSTLDEVVVVYRGVTDYNKQSIKSMSWTLNKEIAKWFSNRFKKNGKVYQAKINKKDILAFCNKRKEEEVIVDYTKLYDIELVENI